MGFLDSDDLMEPEHLQTANDFITEMKEPEVVHFNFLWGPEDRSKTNKNVLPASLPNDLFKRCSLHVNCIFIKNSVAKSNLFNESRQLMFVEDWDFFIKLSIRYPIHLRDVLTTYLVDHDDRNMRKFDLEKWIAKRDAITKSLQEDKVMMLKYPDKIALISAHMNSLLALNLAIDKSRRKSLHHFYLAIKDNYMELFSKRTLAIIKHLILK